MQGHELRRLITSFLVLALLCGSASLAITSLLRTDSEGLVATRDTVSSDGNVPKIGDTAFVEKVPLTALEGYDLAKEFSPSVSPEDNYTDNLTKGLAYHFVTTNPTGPDATNHVMVPPQLETIMNEYVMDAALSPTTYAIDETRMKIAQMYTTEQVRNYFEVLDTAFAASDGTQSISGLIDRTGGNPDQSAVQASNFIFADTQEKLYATVVPAPAAELHRAVLSYFELNRKLTDLDYNIDPLKAAVFAAKFPELRKVEEERIRLTLETMSEKAPELFADARDPFFIASLLGIPRAHAEWPVADWKNRIQTYLNSIGINGTWTQMILQYAQRVALQILKNQIVGKMIQQTIKWVQGGGKPQFITNWKRFLQDAGTQAANRVLTDLAPNLCQNFRSFIPEALQRTEGGSLNKPYENITCTLDQIVSNVRGFYEDFKNGGWLDLIALNRSENNVWGAVVLATELVYKQSGKAAAASQSSAQANGGFSDGVGCSSFDLETVREEDIPGLGVDTAPTTTIGNLPNAPRVFSSNAQDFAGLGPRGCYDVFSGGQKLDRYCEVKICRPEGRDVKTPGRTIGGQLEKALGTTMDNVVNASDIAGLVAAVIDSAINKLTSFATNGVLGLFNGSGGGSGSSGGSTGGGGTTPGTGGGLTPGDLSGDDGTSPADIAALKDQAVQLIAGQQRTVQEAINDSAAWLSLSYSVQSLLGSVQFTCARFAADAAQRSGAIDRIRTSMTDDRTTLQDASSQMASTSAAVQAATSATRISDLVASVNTLNNQLSTTVSRVATRYGQLTGVKFDAETNLANRSCNTPLTTLDE